MRSGIKQELIDRCVELYKEGMTTTAIGELLGVHNSTVRKYVIRYGDGMRGSNDYRKVPLDFVDKFIELYHEGKSASQIGELTGYSKPVVLRYLKARGVEMRKSNDPVYLKMTPEKEKEIIDRYLTGESSITIAEDYLLSPTGVLKILVRNGIVIRERTENRKKFDKEQVEEIVALYHEGYSTVQLGVIFNVHSSTINNYLTEAVVEFRQAGWASRNFTDQEEENIVNRYLAGESARELARSLGLPHHISITSALKRQGVSQYEAGHFNKVYSLNPHVFDSIDNEHAAYWLGFLYADGCIYEEKKLVMALARKDSDHLKKLQLFFETDYPVVDSMSGKYPQCTFVITDRHLANRLLELGLGKGRPDFSKAWDYVPVDLRNHFIRGLFDGDGSARKDGSLCFLGQYVMMEFIRKEIAEVAGTNPDLKIVRHTKSEIYYLYYSGKNVARKLTNYLYNNATVWLERKRDRQI